MVPSMKPTTRRISAGRTAKDAVASIDHGALRLQRAMIKAVTDGAFVIVDREDAAENLPFSGRSTSRCRSRSPAHRSFPAPGRASSPLCSDQRPDATVAHRRSTANDSGSGSFVQSQSARSTRLTDRYSRNASRNRCRRPYGFSDRSDHARPQYFTEPSTPSASGQAGACGYGIRNQKSPSGCLF